MSGEHRAARRSLERDPLCGLRKRISRVKFGQRGRSVLRLLTTPAILAALIVFGTGLGPSHAHAAPSAEELRQKVAAAETEAHQLQEALSTARQRMFDAEAEAELAESELNRVESRLARGGARAANLADRVETAGARLQSERQRLSRARKNLADRLLAIYIAGPTATDEVAMGAADFGELLVGTQYMAAIEGADGRLAERVAQVRGRVARELAELRRDRAAAERHRAALASDRDRVGAISSTADARAGELRQTAATRDAMLGQLAAKMDVWADQVEQAERREARQAAATDTAEAEVERWLGGPYSIPTAIVMCESGGNYSALNPSSGAGGAYQIMPATWAGYGGQGLPHQASKAEQDRIAALIWAESGPAPWVCKA